MIKHLLATLVKGRSFVTIFSRESFIPEMVTGCNRTINADVSFKSRSFVVTFTTPIFRRLAAVNSTRLDPPGSESSKKRASHVGLSLP